MSRDSSCQTTIDMTPCIHLLSDDTLEDVTQRARTRDIPEPMAGLGVRLRATRERKGWNQQELANASGVDSPRISRIEGGKRMGGLTAAHVVRLARALEVSVGYLLAGESAGPMLSLHEQIPLSVVTELVEDVQAIRAKLDPGAPKRKDSGTLRVRRRP